jgi:hypothetical protein
MPKGIKGFQKGYTPWNKKYKLRKKCLICKRDFEIPSYFPKAKFCSRD